LRGNSNYSWLATTIIIFVALLFVLNTRETRQNTSPESIRILPTFKVTDTRGQIIRSSFYAGKNTYIQFINAYMPHEVELFREVYAAWRNNDVWFLLICGNNAPIDLGIRLSNHVAIIDGQQKENAEDAYSSFGLRKDDGYYFIFNSKGSKVSSARSATGYERGPKIFLNEIINGAFFSIEELLGKNHNVIEYEWLAQIKKLMEVNRNRKYYVFSLFTKICDSCAGAGIIQFMKNTKSHLREDVYIASILSSNYTESDTVNMRSQLKLEYPVFVAENKLRTKWDELINKYNDEILSDIVFIVDSTGNIVDIAYRRCNCYGSFFQSAIRLLGYSTEGMK
jgi:hypothetical protein